MRRGTKYFRRRKKTNSFILKTPDEIDILREAGDIVARAFQLLEQEIKPGAVLRELDRQVEEFIRSQGAKPLYKGYQGNPPTHPPFPGVICASVNREICHGIPDGRKLKAGDIVGIDIGLKYKEFCGDACVTYAVGQVDAATQKLLDAAEASLYRGIDAAQPGRRLGEVGAAIETYVHSQGLSIVTDYGGHGLGRALHEPISVPHHGPANYGPRLKPGMVFTIEPMVNAGRPNTRLMSDGWSVETVDGSLSAQFEHTIAITNQGPQILSQPLD